ncbi:heavy metal translocating P-type ATPase [Pseudoroseomonas rhizosphaerae]|uniref:P-type Zn(2+) transporter n=1 Tax=Teichococcus rhizosphaerae TaxID=1335062 RepID=A0A2C7A5C9_9PROT|nr:heavy metal translocating P-type ATPase [Pseudoroseomonas rhizosphaerae]PHK93189.1 heavy metal translocating P-type ATPase [Pseudoroseomonas rhizosphaerae]
MAERYRLRHLRLAWASLGLALGAALWMRGSDAAAGWAWSAAALPVALHVAAATWRGLRGGRPGVDVVALAAMLAAVAMQEAATAAVIALMVAGGEALEGWAGARAGGALADLLARAPRRARRVRGGALDDIPVEAIGPGDLLLVRPGDTVPADGVLADGAATLDLHALTGESLPVALARGAPVQSGAVNAGPAFHLRASRDAASSTFAAIIRLTEAATASRAPLARLADRWAVAFVGLTALVAGGAWLASGDPLRALAVLVVATPCPLILAAPVALMAGIGRSARRGIIVKDAGALEQLAGIRTVVFDKTGTLTSGRPALVAVDADPALGRAAALRLAASLAQGSSHPVSAALCDAARAAGLALARPEAVAEAPGAGLRGTVEGRPALLGSEACLRDAGLPPRGFGPDAALAELEGMIAWLAVDGRAAAAFVFSDAPRPEAPSAVRRLRALGLRRLVLLSGDRQAAALAVGRALRLDAVLAEQSPADKIAVLRAEDAAAPTAMVGDGVNDAPALAAARVGIAMGAAGTAAAAEAAGIVLVVDRLDRVAEAVAIARRSRAVALRAIGLGMGASVAAMLPAAAGLLPPLQGALLQEGIDVLSILFALTALRPGRAERRPALLPAEAGLAERMAEHAALRGLAETIRGTAEQLRENRADPAALSVLVRQLQGELLPHQQAEERMLYPAAAERLGSESVAALVRMHAEIEAMAGRIAAAARLAEQGVAWAVLAPSLRRTLFALEALLRVHLMAEEDVLAGLEDRQAPEPPRPEQIPVRSNHLIG